jgi:uncharacterized protein YbbC (DUF1343 family)
MRAQRSSPQGVPEYHRLRKQNAEVWEACLRRSQRSSVSFFLVLVLLPFSSSSVAATAKSSAKTSAKKGRPGRVQTGLDVLEAQRFAPLNGKHVGLITNHTGLDAQEKTTIDRLAHAPGVTLVALFSPEHGLAGKMDDKVTSTKEPSTGLPVYSLYGETKRPTDEMLNGIDALVFDIQDAGVRFYTYTTTMGYCMEAAAKKGIAFYVLDRPNPIGGAVVEGPMLDEDKRDFVAYFPLPVRYGLTIGELAQLYNVENKIGADLHVIQMKNWHRNYFYESTGLRWVPPSPNLRTTKGAILYPGLEILQNAGISVGRGTEAPFEIFGAPWMNGEEVASALNAKHLPGLKFFSQLLIPVSGLYAGQRCGGVSIRIGEKSAVRSMRMGLEIAAVLKKLYTDKFDLAKTVTLLGNAATVQELLEGAPPEKIVADWKDDLAAYETMRRKYMLYK